MFCKSMSEFKYACPVCGQHIKCDSSQTGSTMECPTCFQKIVVPQSPASDDQKLIITGSKVSDRKIPLPNGETAVVSAPQKKIPGAIVVIVILIGMAAGAAFVYRGTIFKSKRPAAAGPVETSNAPAQTKAPAKPVVIAPPASDTNWTLNLDAVTIPDSAAAGRIHGQNFIVERASFQNGTLTLRAGTHGPVEFGVTINFEGAMAEALDGQTINITTNTDKSARITLRWTDGGQAMRESFDGGAAMRLEFGALANNRLPGKIYLCTPDETKSYIAGTLNVAVRKPRPPK
jgi:DNA-directed RNA polymerase subunit RPC12/RpoP